MLYDSASKTLLETVAPGLIRSDGSTLTEAGIEALGRSLGRSIADGPIERVALVFMMEEEAGRFVDVCKRYGVGCRALVMATGEEATLFEGSRVSMVAQKPSGPIVPVLREAAWPHVASTVHRRLLKNLDQGPWLTFAHDEGQALARVPVDELSRRSFEALEAEALANLDKCPFLVEATQHGAAQVLDEYAPESLLLKRVCAEVCRVVGAPLCLVATREGMLLAAAATNVNLVVVADRMFREASGRRVSPLPFLVSPEGIQGFASGLPHGASPTERSKPWWKFW
ncbi:MAG: hypothetical protein SFW67_02865 [Myxococcaceae bacterium]|nr:hypothetical protein [Myxococcaceae bacterium]